VIFDDGGDEGSILLETQDLSKTLPVVWCSLEDIYNFCDIGEFRYKPVMY